MKFRTYEESTDCVDFYSGYCARTKGFCHPNKDDRFPGCGDYFIVPPIDGKGMTAIAATLAATFSLPEEEIFAAMQKAAHQ